MSAYAALVSLGHIIEQLQHHPRPPISLHELQVESLTEKVTFLQDFLEKNSINGGSEESEALESRIADAAHAAEDMIESLIVDQILAGSTITHHGRQISGSPEFDQGSGSPEFYQGSGSTEFYQKGSDSREFYQGSGSTEFYQGLQKVIEDMDFIKKDAMEIKAKMGNQDELQHEYSMFAGSSRSPSMVKNIMVGLDDVLIEIMDKLTGQQSSRQFIPIVGMGGIGSLSLAFLLGRAGNLDKLIWHFEASGVYMVKSGYKVALQNQKICHVGESRGICTFLVKSKYLHGMFSLKCNRFGASWKQ